MKFILSIMLLATTTFSFAETIKVEVNGMVCSMCAQGIEKKFKKIEAVKSIKVDLDKKIVEIDLKDQQNLEDQVITKHIQDSGYNVASIKREKNE